MKKILNILLGVMMAITAVLLVYAMATGGSEAAIGANLIWGYFLFVFAIAAALFCAVFGMIKNPAGIKGPDFRNDGRQEGGDESDVGHQDARFGNYGFAVAEEPTSSSCSPSPPLSSAPSSE